MRNYILNFMNDFLYPAEAITSMLSCYDKAMSTPETTAIFNKCMEQYKENYRTSFRELLNYGHEIADIIDVKYDVIDLLIPICLSKYLRDLYIKENIDLGIWFRSMADLKYKCLECMCVKGYPGTFVAGWFGGFFDLYRFAFGKLQFEIIELETEYHKNGVDLTPDSTVINIHIPRTCTHLDAESLRLSFEEAAAFYKARYNQRGIFHCSSWLLFPRHLEVLSENSNLRRFITTFDIIEHGEFSNDDRFEDLWRLFDTMEQNPDKLPTDSSLRRAYVNWMKNGEKTGWGRGIYVYSKD